MQQIHKAFYEKCTDMKSDIHIASLQIRLMPLGPGLPSPAMLLFNYPVRGIMPIIDRLLININNDDDYYEVSVKMMLSEIMFLFC